MQVPLWPQSVDLAVETDRWEELGEKISDYNKKVNKAKYCVRDAIQIALQLHLSIFIVKTKTINDFQIFQS